jgi:hypothetical protein
MVVLRHQGPNTALGSGARARVGELPQCRVVKNPTPRVAGWQHFKFSAEILDWHAP